MCCQSHEQAKRLGLTGAGAPQTTQFIRGAPAPRRPNLLGGVAPTPPKHIQKIESQKSIRSRLVRGIYIHEKYFVCCAWHWPVLPNTRSRKYAVPFLIYYVCLLPSGLGSCPCPLRVPFDFLPFPFRCVLLSPLKISHCSQALPMPSPIPFKLAGPAELSKVKTEANR